MRLSYLLTLAICLFSKSFHAQTNQLFLTICEESIEEQGQCGVRVVPATVFDSKVSGIDKVVADTSGKFSLNGQSEERIIRFTHNGRNFTYWLPSKTHRVNIVLNKAIRANCVSYLTWRARDAISLGPYFGNGCDARIRVEINGYSTGSSAIVSPGLPNHPLLEYPAFLAEKRKDLLLANEIFSAVNHFLPWTDSLDTRYIREQLLPEETAFIYRDQIVKEKKRANNEYRTIAWQYHAVCMNELAETARLVSTTVFDVKKGKRYVEQSREARPVKTSQRNLNYDKVNRAFALIDAAGFGSLNSKQLTKQDGPIDKEGRQQVIHITHVTTETVYLKKGITYHTYDAYAPEIFIDRWPEINEQRKTFVKCRNLMRSLK